MMSDAYICELKISLVMSDDSNGHMMNNALKNLSKEMQGFLKCGYGDSVCVNPIGYTNMRLLDDG